jgi:RNA-directed DNA polymerase
MAERILGTLGVRINRQKTQIVHVRHGFAFLGYKIKRGSRALRLPEAKIRSGCRAGIAMPFRRKSPSTGSRTAFAGRRGVAFR